MHELNCTDKVSSLWTSFLLWSQFNSPRIMSTNSAQYRNMYIKLYKYVAYDSIWKKTCIMDIITIMKIGFLMVHIIPAWWRWSCRQTHHQTVLPCHHSPCVSMMQWNSIGKKPSKFERVPTLYMGLWKSYWKVLGKSFYSNSSTLARKQHGKTEHITMIRSEYKHGQIHAHLLII